jgi:putative oxidoreductase
MIIGLLLIRLVVGLTLAAHGTQKLFGWFGGPGLEGAGKFMESIGFVPGRRSAHHAGMTEMGAGSLLALGLATPAAAAGLLGAMLVAANANRANGFFVQKGGYEYTLVLGLVALGLAFTGPGALSVDGALGLELKGVPWGGAAAVAGVIGGAIQIGTRRSRPSPGASAG